jgi:hypothetical protein
MIRSKTQTNAGTRRSSYPKKSKDSYGKDSVRAGCCAKRNPVGTQLKKLLSCFGALDSLSCCVDGRGLTISFLFFQVLWPSAFRIQEWTESAGGQYNPMSSQCRLQYRLQICPSRNQHPVKLCRSNSTVEEQEVDQSNVGHS